MRAACASASAAAVLSGIRLVGKLLLHLSRRPHPRRQQWRVLRRACELLVRQEREQLAYVTQGNA
ncbi:hypothetical protein PR003_g25095 [Phytophthora rubi]|uniref:Uncharacterized protein n=1 Tax=Phytophthora rubi TaxID=129364 RepID=A0A6A3IGF5_9STRA|nr:hypothetical protein PR001_g23819 [Phytophthora rubi]KAE9291223.1 hypothetical protein PR003_g25095 [Phytophthora rubi]